MANTGVHLQERRGAEKSEKLSPQRAQKNTEEKLLSAWIYRIYRIYRIKALLLVSFFIVPDWLGWTLARIPRDAEKSPSRDGCEDLKIDS